MSDFDLRGHRAVGGIEHDPSRSLFHGCCAICAVEWPCAAERELQKARLAAAMTPATTPDANGATPWDSQSGDASIGALFIVLRKRDDSPLEIWTFDNQQEAARFYDEAAVQWNEVFLTRVIVGPGPAGKSRLMAILAAAPTPSASVKALALLRSHHAWKLDNAAGIKIDADVQRRYVGALDAAIAALRPATLAGPSETAPEFAAFREAAGDVAEWEVVTSYLRLLKWSDNTPREVRDMVAGNVRAFYSHLLREGTQNEAVGLACGEQP